MSTILSCIFLFLELCSSLLRWLKLWTIIFRMFPQSNTGHSVQFMQFDSDGNLYVYEPGTGCSCTPHRIDQGFTQEDLQLSLSGAGSNDDHDVKPMSQTI